MTLTSALLVLGLAALAVPTARAAAASVAAGATLALAVVLDVASWNGAAPVVDLLRRIDLFTRLGGSSVDPAMLVAALVWCGPAADLVVRAVLWATGLPAPEDAAAAGLRAGRWIGRLERWMLVTVIAAGQPALALIPTGGKALLRYAETVGAARASRPRVERPDMPPAPRPEAYLDYVLVGSLASWTMAVVLGLLAAT